MPKENIRASVPNAIQLLWFSVSAKTGLDMGSPCRQAITPRRRAIIEQWKIKVGRAHFGRIIAIPTQEPPKRVNRLRCPAQLVLPGEPLMGTITGANQVLRFDRIGFDDSHNDIGGSPGVPGKTSLVVKNGFSDRIARDLHGAFLQDQLV
ncbi:hypothetical protein [Microvirga sp. 17 mud 1-3]|uniref:hypothetical protein n=1 Tax=Microvirga sp. 17 mud 1-3 TaxID=2082949 RepID=UPI000D6BB3EE|nr:hypothetical protein [Microvirga sp. 17 mud 1-3]AWM87922.1 hypothetical protein C4E04_15035 [Microvirga sp. 17 mud 1-3]